MRRTAQSHTHGLYSLKWLIATVDKKYSYSFIITVMELHGLTGLSVSTYNWKGALDLPITLRSRKLNGEMMSKGTFRDSDWSCVSTISHTSPHTVRTRQQLLWVFSMYHQIAWLQRSPNQSFTSSFFFFFQFTFHFFPGMADDTAVWKLFFLITSLNKPLALY